MWTLNDILNFTNRSSLIKNESSFAFSFGKKIKFHQLYKYIKSKREYVYNRDIPQLSCLCDGEYYEWAKVDGKVKKVNKSVDVKKPLTYLMSR